MQIADRGPNDIDLESNVHSAISNLKI